MKGKGRSQFWVARLLRGATGIFLVGLFLAIVDLLLLSEAGWMTGWRTSSAFCLASGLLALPVLAYGAYQLSNGFRELGDESVHIQKLLAAALTLLAGILLLLPGPITDIFGLLLLLPAVQRHLISSFLEDRR